MFYNLLYPLADDFVLFNLFKYLTVRAGGAMFTAFLLTVWLGPVVIKTFKHWQKGGSTVKDIAHLAQSLQGKAGTPTMGGVMVLGSFLFSVLLWADLLNPYVWLLLATACCFGLVGLADDYLGITKRWKNGLPGRLRLLIQAALGTVLLWLMVQTYTGDAATAIYLPFLKDAALDGGMLMFTVFGLLVLVGAANAVNLTDGLDGLVSIPAAIAAAALAVLAYIIGRADYTGYLHIPYVPGAGEVAVVAAALVGALLGFLWYNAPPARIFMGDTGSLAVGGLLGMISLIIKQEFALAIIGGLFVLETVSVITQVVSFKMTGKRIFKMAPLHHHFEQMGWPESTIVVRFWIISLLLAVLGLATIKLR